MLISLEIFKELNGLNFRIKVFSHCSGDNTLNAPVPKRITEVEQRCAWLVSGRVTIWAQLPRWSPIRILPGPLRLVSQGRLLRVTFSGKEEDSGIIPFLRSPSALLRVTISGMGCNDDVAEIGI
ncbi:hypothetical protein M8J77_019738 [Diaphorina citri]|nr:hypothetical protein M8J77_019738 [Diaphorina citri]